LNRLSSIGSVPGPGAVAAAARRCPRSATNTTTPTKRTRTTLADGSYWLYEYDALGQMKSGKRYWSDQKGVSPEWRLVKASKFAGAAMPTAVAVRQFDEFPARPIE